MKLVLSTSNLDEALVQSVLALNNQAVATGTVTAAQTAQIGVVDALKVKLAGLSATMGISVGWIVAIAAAIPAVIALLDYTYDSASEMEKATESLTDSMSEFHNEINDGNKKLKSYTGKYDELRKGVDRLGRNISLTTQEYEEYLDISNQIAELLPNMVSYYDAENNKIIDTTKSLQDLTDAYRENAQAKASHFSIYGDDEGNTIGDLLTNYNRVTEGDFYRSVVLANVDSYESVVKAYGTEKVNKDFVLA